MKKALGHKGNRNGYGTERIYAIPNWLHLERLFPCNYISILIFWWKIYGIIHWLLIWIIHWYGLMGSWSKAYGYRTRKGNGFESKPDAFALSPGSVSFGFSHALVSFSNFHRTEKGSFAESLNLSGHVQECVATLAHAKWQMTKGRWMCQWTTCWQHVERWIGMSSIHLSIIMQCLQVFKYECMNP